jgi:starvation-inducible DNA-binding protein
MKLNPIRSELAPDVRAELVTLLNLLLADASDLRSHAKHAHWNVKGLTFLQLHELFDRAAGEADTWIDDLAERAVQLGGVALGTVRLAALVTRLPEFPGGSIEGPAAVAALTESLAAFARAMRAAVEQATRLGDANTADLCTEVSRAADKLIWLLGSHLPETVR